MTESKAHTNQPPSQPHPQSHPSPSLSHHPRKSSWTGSVDVDIDAHATYASPTLMHSRKRSADHLTSETHVSRKGRACLACRKLKVKCDSLERGDSGCSRCQRLGLDCITSKRMRLSLDDDGENTHPSIVRLDRAVEDILARLKMPSLDSYLRTHPSQGLAGQPQPNSHAHAHAQSRSLDEPPIAQQASRSFVSVQQSQSQVLDSSTQHSQSHVLESGTQHSQSNPMESNAQTTRENSRDPNPEDAQEMAPAPMGSLYEVTQLNTLRSRLKYGDPARRSSRKNMENDLISMGVITTEEAEEMFGLFKTTLSRYLFDATIQESRSVLSVRESSSLFFTAIITVTSLHIPGKEKIHAAAHKHLRDLIATSFFDRFHTLEDIRALCIAAFWLPDLSWKLSGHCVRMATELNLHQAFYKALYSQKQSETDRGHAFERARLWYLLYVLDHHFSIAYGRPPVTAELQAIKEYDVFLNAPECTPSDRRVLSQVTLFIILSRAYNHFGLEAERLMDGDDVTLLTHQRFIEDLDRWRYQFRHALNRDAHVGDYPAVGVELHYYFASMMLNSLALRGRSLATISSTTTLPTSLRPLASHAISSAHQILIIVLEEPSIRDSMVGVPLYLHTVIAFAVVFLIKMSSRWTSIGVSIDPEVETKPLIEGVIELFRGCQAGRGHILYAMADGFERLLRRNLGATTNHGNGSGNNTNSNANARATQNDNDNVNDRDMDRDRVVAYGQNGMNDRGGGGGGGGYADRMAQLQSGTMGITGDQHDRERDVSGMLHHQQANVSGMYGLSGHGQGHGQGHGGIAMTTSPTTYTLHAHARPHSQSQADVQSHSHSHPNGLGVGIVDGIHTAAQTTATATTTATSTSTSTYDPYNGVSISVSPQTRGQGHSQSQSQSQPGGDGSGVGVGTGSGRVPGVDPDPASASVSGSYEGWQTEDDMLWSMGMGYDLLAMAPDVNAHGLSGFMGWPGSGSTGSGDGSAGAGAGYL